MPTRRLSGVQYLAAFHMSSIFRRCQGAVLACLGCVRISNSGRAARNFTEVVDPSRRHRL